MDTKTFLTFFLLFKLMSAVNAQYDFDAVERARMAKARVKTQTQWTYDYVNDKPATKGYKSAVTKFDVKGNITEVANYNQDGKVISSIRYEYDNRNNRTLFEQRNDLGKVVYSQKIVTDASGVKTREYGFDGNDQYNNTYTYDGGGRLIEINYTVNNTLVEKRQIKYSGNKTEISVYNASGALTFRQENTYNDLGLLVSEIRKSEQGNTIHSRNMQYNNFGDLLSEIKKRADDKLDYQKAYQYDKNNRPVKEETTNLDGTKYTSHEYQYSPTGDLVFESWRKNERAIEASTNKYTYNSNGLYTDKDSYFASYKLKSLYKYVYDFY